MDIAFPRARVAVFVDGCFWHGCPDHSVVPKNNAEFWASKIAANRARDTTTDANLLALNWTAVRCWEHEDPEVALRRVVEKLEERLAPQIVDQMEAPRIVVDAKNAQPNTKVSSKEDRPL